jgi:hypothetical protein
MNAIEDPGAELTPAEGWDLRRLATFMVPANAEYGVLVDAPIAAAA